MCIGRGYWRTCFMDCPHRHPVTVSLCFGFYGQIGFGWGVRPVFAISALPGLFPFGLLTRIPYIGWKSLADPVRCCLSWCCSRFFAWQFPYCAFRMSAPIAIYAHWTDIKSVAFEIRAILLYLPVGSSFRLRYRMSGFSPAYVITVSLPKYQPLAPSRQFSPVLIPSHIAALPRKTFPFSFLKCPFWSYIRFKAACNTLSALQYDATALLRRYIHIEWINSGRIF